MGVLMTAFALLTVGQHLDVIMTRTEAEALSTEQLTERLLRDFPHRRILSSEVGPAHSAGPQFPASPLDYITFAEQPMALSGRFCSARRIMAGFDSLDGGPPYPTEPGSEHASRRLFSVSAVPLLAIVNGTANSMNCGKVIRFAQLPTRTADIARRMVADVLMLSEQARAGKTIEIPVTCVNERRGGEICDGLDALAQLDWSQLGNVDLANHRTGQPNSLQFWGTNYWVVEVEGEGRIEALKLRRSIPPPF